MSALCGRVCGVRLCVWGAHVCGCVCSRLIRRAAPPLPQRRLAEAGRLEARAAEVMGDMARRAGISEQAEGLWAK